MKLTWLHTKKNNPYSFGLMDNKMTRIGVFYDGNYFRHVSNYYLYAHPRKSRLNITGLHRFIRETVAEEEKTDRKFCQIVESHYFSGRRSAKSAKPEQLANEREFDEVLSREGVITHYLPLKTNGETEYEKGIDVWLALEAFEQAYYKRFNVLVLIAGDGDYLPLIRKLNALGTRVLLLSWEFEYEDQKGNPRYTSTAESLLREATYPYSMNEVIDSKTSKNNPLINDLFIPQKMKKSTEANHTEKPKRTTEENNESTTNADELEGQILSFTPNKFGFIKHEDYPQNLFFGAHSTSYSNFEKGDIVTFKVEKDKDRDIAYEVKKKG